MVVMANRQQHLYVSIEARVIVVKLTIYDFFLICPVTGGSFKIFAKILNTCFFPVDYAKMTVILLLRLQFSLVVFPSQKIKQLLKTTALILLWEHQVACWL